MPFLDLDEGPWVAGGAGRLIFENAQSLDRSDIDVFFPNEASLKWGASMIERHARSNYIRNPTNFDMNHNAPTIKLFRKKKEDEPETLSLKPVVPMFTEPETPKPATPEEPPELFAVQLIAKVFRPTLEELIGSFDYEAAMFVTDGYEMYVRESAVLGDRVLRLSDTGRVGHIGRLVKYASKGFYPAPGLLSRTLRVNTERFNATENLTEIISTSSSPPEYSDNLP